MSVRSYDSNVWSVHSSNNDIESQKNILKIQITKAERIINSNKSSISQVRAATNNLKALANQLKGLEDLEKNVSFANAPGVRELKATLKNLYPSTRITNENIYSLVNGHVHIPNNNNENTASIKAKKAAARVALANVLRKQQKRATQRRRRSRSRSRGRSRGGGQQNTNYEGTAQSLIANLLENPVAPGYYTFIAWDEIPKPNLAPGYTHAFVKNIRVGPDGQIRLENGTTVVPYEPPSPPAGSGQHTYHFALYKQSAPTLATNTRNTQRAKYNRNAHVRNLGLEFVAHRDFTIIA